MNRSPKKREISHEQYLTTDYDYPAASPWLRKNGTQNSQSNSEMKRLDDKMEESRDIELSPAHNNHEGNDEDSVKDIRLMIQKKPKQTKKNTSAFSILTEINICVNCALIIKKTDKSKKECTKCQGKFVHSD